MDFQQVTNTVNGSLNVLCCCAPACEHGDTYLLDEARHENGAGLLAP